MHGKGPASTPLDVTGVEKRSGLGFIRAIASVHARGSVALALETDGPQSLPGLRVTERLSVGEEDGGWWKEPLPVRHEETPAQVSLTSGTTGTSKAILLPHRALGDVTVRLNDVMGLTSEVREYVGVPVTFSFGFGRVRAVSAAGGAAYLPPRGFRLDEFSDMLGRGEVNALSAVPTLLRLILSDPSRVKTQGPRLRWLEIGSQAMSADEKRQIRALFPQARIVQHYGLTEASRSTFLNVSDASDAELASVGRPTGQVELDRTAGGEIKIRGPNVASAMITAEGLQPITDDKGWLVTRDLGRFEKGALIFEGRSDDLINVGGLKIQPDDFERRLRAKGLSRRHIAAARGRDPLRGELVVVASEPGSHEDDVALKAAAAAVAEDMGIKGAFALFPVDRLPTTATGKIQRSEVATRFEREAGAQTTSAVEAAPGPRLNAPSDGVIGAFVSVFGEAGRNEAASFDSLGGDSLNYVTLLMALEEVLPNLPSDWDAMSVGALSALAAEQVEAKVEAAPRRQLPRNLDTLRGVACVLIVALHVVGVAPTEGLKIPAGSPWHQWMEALRLIRLPLFTTLAGFLYGAVPATRNGFVSFMGRKFKQLLVPLLFATMVFFLLRGRTYGLHENLLWAYISGYKHLWYLYALLLMFAVVAAIDVRFSPPNWVWCALIAVVAATYWAVPVVPVFHLKNAIYLLPFFIVGVLIYRVPQVLESRLLLVGSVIAFGAMLVLQQLDGSLFYRLNTYGLTGWIAGAAVCLALLRLFPRARGFELLAGFSFSIYLWHPAANGAVRDLLIKLGVHATWPLFVVGTLAGVGLPVLLHLVMQRLPKFVSAPVIGR